LDDARDYGAHGRFDDRARDTSWQLWLTKRRRALAAAAAGAVISTAIGAAMRGRTI
jgi:hypothetical protein